jgi:plastocyanin
MPSRLPRRFAALTVALVAVVALGACGSSGSKTEPAKTVTNGEITIEAFDVHFDVGDIKTTAGPLTVKLVNKGAIDHTFKIDGTDFELKTGPNQEKTGTVTLEKGTYDYECTIAGHKAQGMKGTIEVS